MDLDQRKLDVLVRLACRYMNNKTDAEDLVYSTILKVLEKETIDYDSLFAIVRSRLYLDSLAFKAKKNRLTIDGKRVYPQRFEIHSYMHAIQSDKTINNGVLKDYFGYEHDYLGPIALKELKNRLTPAQNKTIVKYINRGFKTDKDISSHMWFIRKVYKKDFT